MSCHLLAAAGNCVTRVAPSGELDRLCKEEPVSHRAGSAAARRGGRRLLHYRLHGGDNRRLLTCTTSPDVYPALARDSLNCSEFALFTLKSNQVTGARLMIKPVSLIFVLLGWRKIRQIQSKITMKEASTAFQRFCPETRGSESPCRTPE